MRTIWRSRRIHSAMAIGAFIALGVLTARAGHGAPLPDGTGGFGGAEGARRAAPMRLGPAAPYVLSIGPIDGITEAWHVAPDATAVPLGALLTFRVHAPASAAVSWQGAVEVERNGDASIAVCRLERVGRMDVGVRVVDGGKERSDACALDVVAVDPADVRIAATFVETGAIDVGAGLEAGDLNPRTVDLFFGPSIATLRDLGGDLYLTSVGRPVPVTVTVDPPGFGPLVEWRIDGAPRGIGASSAYALRDPGLHEISFGPPAAARAIKVETYRTTITHFVPATEGLRADVPYVFFAQTEPPGYEREITWLAATKFGSALPVLGGGAMFVCEFRDVYGPHPDGGLWAWFGVKADNAAMGQDDKNPCPPDPTPPDPTMDGPHDVGELADFDEQNVVVAGGAYPGIPASQLERDGSGSSPFFVATGQDAVAGFDLSGRVRYPAKNGGGVDAPIADGGPFPLVVIAHGNHRRFADAVGGDPSDENYAGYTYLQDHLARHGFISVSIDLDDFTTLFPGILARAWLVLCHVERMEAENAGGGAPLEGNVDLSRIAFIGHSRGGDAVVQAQRMDSVVGGANGGPAVGPGSGEGTFGIDAVWSIAATRFFDGVVNWDVVGVVQAVVPETKLSGAIPFLGMWGDADGDVSGPGEVGAPFNFVVNANHVEGIYDASAPGPKQFVWIEGANHNFWNTSWPEDDGEFDPGGGVIDVVPIRISDTDQRDLAIAYGTALLRGYVAGDDEYLDYFRFAANQLPPVPIAETRVHLQYKNVDAARLDIDDFEANDALGTTSEGVGGVDTTTLVNPDEIELTGAYARIPAATQSWYHKTRGILFEWNAATDFYETVVPGGGADVSEIAVLSFRIAQDRRDPNSTAEPVVRVELRDGLGVVASVDTDEITNIPVHQERADDIDLTKSMLKTIRIPFCKFLKEEPNLDLTDIEKIRFVFFSRAAGKMAIDDIEFSD
jgi:hypothetical protein